MTSEKGYRPTTVVAVVQRSGKSKLHTFRVTLVEVSNVFPESVLLPNLPTSNKRVDRLQGRAETVWQ